MINIKGKNQTRVKVEVNNTSFMTNNSLEIKYCHMIIWHFKIETGEFLAQMASNTENVSIWWRHHASNGIF